MCGSKKTFCGRDLCKDMKHVIYYVWQDIACYESVLNILEMYIGVNL